jgi:hypothetical protein
MLSSLNQNSLPSLARLGLRRGLVFGVLIIAALMAFEMFNYSTTEYSLSDLLGNLEFMGLRWATILAIAFCTIDFAGLARLFTPEQGADEPMEVWYLFGAWILAAIMNAMLTWWGVSVAVVNHTPTHNALVSRDLVLQVVPVFVALMVFLIRILIIGTFSVAGERLFSQAARRRSVPAGAARSGSYRQGGAVRPLPSTAVRPSPLAAQSSFRAAPKPIAAPGQGYAPRPEPSYHPISMGSRPNDDLPTGL